MRIELDYATNSKGSLMRWLVDNIGDYKRITMGSIVGNGWRLTRVVVGHGFRWVVEIDDSFQATLFILRWM